MAGAHYLVLIHAHPDKQEVLRQYERQADPIMRRHGGGFERVLRPIKGADDPDTPDEVHLLAFASAEGFAAFRADPDLLPLRALREEAVRRAVVIAAADVPLARYLAAGEAPPPAGRG
jgi:uncharacterized protein (DUF1330 family)